MSIPRISPSLFIVGNFIEMVRAFRASTLIKCIDDTYESAQRACDAKNKWGFFAVMVIPELNAISKHFFLSQPKKKLMTSLFVYVAFCVFFLTVVVSSADRNEK